MGEEQMEESKRKIVEALEAGRVSFAPGLAESIASISRENPDYSITQTSLSGAWSPNERNQGGFEIYWRTKSAGGGSATFYMKDGKLLCDNECMGKEFLKSVMIDFIDRCDLTET